MSDTGMDKVVDVSSTDEWRRLSDRFEALRGRHLRELFADDPDRGSRMTVSAADLYLDYSKQRVDDETMAALMTVARKAGVEERRDAMFAGRHINTTEDRAVLHVALRMPRTEHLEVDGQDVVGEVHEVLDRMGSVANAIRSATGPARPGNGSPRWSISASGAQTWVRPWPTRRCSTTPPRTSNAGSCPTSIRSTSTPRRTISIRPRHCSSSARRRSPHWRR